MVVNGLFHTYLVSKRRTRALERVDAVLVVKRVCYLVLYLPYHVVSIIAAKVSVI